MKSLQGGRFASIVALLVGCHILFGYMFIIIPHETRLSFPNPLNSSYKAEMVVYLNSSFAYVIGAYLVSERVLRLIISKNCSEISDINADFFRHSAYLSSSAATIRPIYDCPWWYSTACQFGGFYVTIPLPSKVVNDAVELISYFNGKESHLPISHTYTLTEKKRHFFGVCYPPMFFFSDSFQLVQSLEFWIASGATKFFIYYQSVSSDVMTVLEWYKADNRLDVDLVHWPALTNDQHDQSLYYSGQILAINDCLHRARSSVEHVTIVDLDELIVPAQGTLRDFIEKHSDNYAALVFESRTAKVAADDKSGKLIFVGLISTMNVIPLQDVTDRSVDSVNFSFLKDVKIESVLKGARQKLIVRPEQIQVVNIHYVSAFESHTSKRQKTMNENEACVYHFRTIPSAWIGKSNSTKSDWLTTVSSIMTKNLHSRLKSANSTLNHIVRNSYNLRIFKKSNKAAASMEACLANLWHKHSGQLCFTASHCAAKLKKLSVAWRFTDESWSVVG